MAVPLRIDEMFAFIASDETGEGICAFPRGDGMMMPMVGADMDRVSDLRTIAQAVATHTGKTIKICRFSTREQIGEILPQKFGVG